jgi:hypothetical protein
MRAFYIYWVNIESLKSDADYDKTTTSMMIMIMLMLLIMMTTTTTMMMMSKDADELKKRSPYK